VVAGAATVGLVLGSAGAASAGDATLFLSDVDGHSLGTMTHLDAETDTFRVCDTRSDARGVTGKLYMYQAGWKLKETEADGSDSGCDSFKYDVRPYVAKYKMKLCWSGSNICASKEFTED
jgi:hypothetical protein